MFEKYIAVIDNIAETQHSDSNTIFIFYDLTVISDNVSSVNKSTTLIQTVCLIYWYGVLRLAGVDGD